MKLISMLDFVLKQNYTTTLDISQIDFYDKELSILEKIRNYANFLKQPLNLGMFVPCYENGNPIILDTEHKECPISWSIDEIEKYKKAKEKVLFEDLPIVQAKWLVNSFSTIESLSDISNTITPIYLNNNAIKQIGL